MLTSTTGIRGALAENEDAGLEFVKVDGNADPSTHFGTCEDGFKVRGKGSDFKGRLATGEMGLAGGKTNLKIWG